MLEAAFKALKRVTGPEFSFHWAVLCLVADAAITAVIIKKVPFTNVDWETYGQQVDVVLGGDFDYAHVEGSTGPIAYPAGHVYVYGLMRLLKLSTLQCQAVFAVFYLISMFYVFGIYRRAGAPGWLLALCVLSKRSHSVFVLRLFNDAITSTLSYLAIWCFIQDHYVLGSVAYSLSVSVKMHPILFAPAIAIGIVLRKGWSKLLQLSALMLFVQLALAAPFLAVNPKAYFARSFGGPGDLQQAWSVNWRFLPESVFFHKAFAPVLLVSMALLLLWFAHQHWLPEGGVFSRRIWAWKAESTVPPIDLVGLIFSQNFVCMAFLRTIHFQFVVWYFHTVPFLAWLAVRPDAHNGLAWLLRCAFVAVLSIAVEVPYILTGRALVRGPDGREWETDGAPTKHGSLMLQLIHTTILLLLVFRSRRPTTKQE